MPSFRNHLERIEVFSLRLVFVGLLQTKAHGHDKIFDASSHCVTSTVANSVQHFVQ